MEKGTRVLNGRHYILAGRGSRETMKNEAAALRRRWAYVRIVPAGNLGRVLDDYLVYVFELKPRYEQRGSAKGWEVRS